MKKPRTTIRLFLFLCLVSGAVMIPAGWKLYLYAEARRQARAERALIESNAKPGSPWWAQHRAKHLKRFQAKMALYTSNVQAHLRKEAAQRSKMSKKLGGQSIMLVIDDSL